MIITLFSMATTGLAGYIFSKTFSVSGLAIGRSIGYIIQAVMLVIFIIFINKKEKIFAGLPLKPIMDTAKILILTLCISPLGFIMQNKINFVINSKLNSLLKLGTIGSVLIILFLIFSYAFKIPEITSFLNKRFNKS
jgi:peptidoglycan biosynthesis protein MviN/MurJ (putative lipid II flippase)